MSNDTKDISLFRGILKFDRHTLLGVRTGYVDIGEYDRFDSQEPAITEIELFTSRNPGGGKVKGFVSKIVPKCSFRFFNATTFNVALASLGIETTVSQTGSTVTAEALTAGVAPALDRYYRTAKRGLSVITVKQGVTTKTVTTDYTVDATRGEIYIVPTGSIDPAGAALTIDYTYATIALTAVAPYTQGLINTSVAFTGDSATGAKYDVDIWNMQVKPQNVIKLLHDPSQTEFGNFELQGDILDDTAGAFGGDSTYRFMRMIKTGQVS